MTRIPVKPKLLTWARERLHKQGEEDLKVIDQMANYALLEWPDNIDISDKPPTCYVPQLKARFSPADWQRMHEPHALPEGWELLAYPGFLVARRKLMAAIVRRGFETLGQVRV